MGAGLAWFAGRGPFGEGKDVALRAVVIGGGIGGIAAAVALARAGIDVQVHEQAQQLADPVSDLRNAPDCWWMRSVAWRGFALDSCQG